MMPFLRRLIIISALFFPLSLYAEPQMTLTLNPIAPGPYEKVDIILNSYSFDVNTTELEWTVDGAAFASGLGLKKISVITGGVGEAHQIMVKATTANDGVLQAGISLAAQSVDIVWESVESYIPPFYEGKALPGEGSFVRVTALPTMSDGGAQLSPNTISYNWYINDNYIDAASGIGKQSAIIPLDILSNETDIKVRARTPSGMIAEKTVNIYQHKTMPMVYMYDPLLGIARNKNLSGRMEVTKNFTLSFEPYYLSTKGLETASKYTWLLDGLPITPLGNTLLSLQPKENSTGSKKLSISVNNTKRRLQDALTELEIIFDTRQ